MRKASGTCTRERAIVMAMAAALMTHAGCTGVRRLVVAPSPHEAYSQMLRQSGVDRAGLGQDWIRAGEDALRTPVIVETPLQETGYFPADEATAVGYRFDLQRGRRLSVEVTFESPGPGRLFVDLFELRDNGPRRVASQDVDQAVLVHDAERDGAYVVRLQPELLRGGRFTITQRTLASLRLPVTGIDMRTVQGLFGARRDSGAREHEGIDIFAPRGTPAIAVANGLARPDTNGLGGNVVWLSEAGGSRRYYYAHLDRWEHDGTTVVRTGDVVGYVGNTGNARSTSPHLHFGIYEGDAIDPLPFLRPDDRVPPAPTAFVDRLGSFVRTTAMRTDLVDGPGRNRVRVARLERNTLLAVRGATSGWLRAELPDRAIGYLATTAVTAADRAIRSERLADAVNLFERPLPSAPVMQTVDVGVRVEVLGVFAGFERLRTPDGDEGWRIFP